MKKLAVLCVDLNSDSPSAIYVFDQENEKEARELFDLIVEQHLKYYGETPVTEREENYFMDDEVRIEIREVEDGLFELKRMKDEEH